MITGQPVTDIAHVVQMAVAPVFLLTGVGAVLSVLTTRLSRVIDRGRQLDHWVSEGHDPSWYAHELLKLAKRNTLINTAITLATMSAFFVCAVILVIFTSQLFPSQSVFGDVVTALFILAMICLMGSLAFFLGEIKVATTIRYFGHSLPPRA
jgi:hypothetical protein